jgi:hypothetical protein
MRTTRRRGLYRAPGPAGRQQRALIAVEVPTSPQSLPRQPPGIRQSLPLFQVLVVRPVRGPIGQLEQQRAHSAANTSAQSICPSPGGR